MAFKLRALHASMLILALSFNISAEQPRIDLTEGSLFLAGGLELHYEWTNFSKPSHQFMLKSDLGGGYFILDNLAIGLSIPTKWHIVPVSGGSIGLKLFSTYFFDLNSGIYPYLGGSVTPQYSMGQNEFQLLAGLEGGVLVSLSESVALDFGLRPEVFFKLYETQKWRVTLPAGFFGVRAVF